jgi:hypothetical protein
MAPKVGAEVIYISAATDEQDHTDYEDLRDSEYEPDEHEGEIEAVQVVYVAGGVAHQWSQMAEWHFERISQSMSFHDERQAMYDRFMARASDEDWAQRIASDKRFYTATRNVQRDIVVEILVEMSGESPDDLINARTRRDIFAQAVGSLRPFSTSCATRLSKRCRSSPRISWQATLAGTK